MDLMSAMFGALLGAALYAIAQAVHNHRSKKEDEKAYTEEDFLEELDRMSSMVDKVMVQHAKVTSMLEELKDFIDEGEPT